MKHNDPARSDLFRQTLALAEETQKNRKEMIQAEISTISSFCDRAETELRLGKLDRVEKMLQAAREGIDTAKEQLSKLPSNDDRRNGLREAISVAEKRFKRIKREA
jgi:hypothetical protein